MYMDKPNGIYYPNLINKIEFEPNFILAKLELECYPCDFGCINERKSTTSYSFSIGAREHLTMSNK